MVGRLDASMGGRRRAADVLLPGQSAMNHTEGVMRQIFRTTAVFLVLIVAAQGDDSFAQNRGVQRGAPPPPRPAPRWPDGRPNMGPLPGEKGLWGVCPTTQPL